MLLARITRPLTVAAAELGSPNNMRVLTRALFAAQLHINNLSLSVAVLPWLFAVAYGVVACTCSSSSSCFAACTGIFACWSARMFTRWHQLETIEFMKGGASRRDQRAIVVGAAACVVQTHSWRVSVHWQLGDKAADSHKGTPFCCCIKTGTITNQ